MKTLFFASASVPFRLSRGISAKERTKKSKMAPAAPPQRIETSIRQPSGGERLSKWHVSQPSGFAHLAMQLQKINFYKFCLEPGLMRST